MARLTLRRLWKAAVRVTRDSRATAKARHSSCSSVASVITCLAQLTSGRQPISCSLAQSRVTALCTVCGTEERQAQGCGDAFVAFVYT